MAFMNEWEIDELAQRIGGRAPHLVPYARFLADWKDVVNANSDGWAHWKAGSSCADRLVKLFEQAIEAARSGGEMPQEAAFKKALAPIRALATKKGLAAPDLAPEAASPRP